MTKKMFLFAIAFCAPVNADSIAVTIPAELAQSVAATAQTQSTISQKSQQEVDALINAVLNALKKDNLSAGLQAISQAMGQKLDNETLNGIIEDLEATAFFNFFVLLKENIFDNFEQKTDLEIGQALIEIGFLKYLREYLNFDFVKQNLEDAKRNSNASDEFSALKIKHYQHTRELATLTISTYADLEKISNLGDNAETLGRESLLLLKKITDTLHGLCKEDIAVGVYVQSSLPLVYLAEKIQASFARRDACNRL